MLWNGEVKVSRQSHNGNFDLATDVEIEISCFLVMELNSQIIAQYLCEKVDSSEYNLDEKLTFLNALIHMGFYEESLSVITTWTQHSKYFPWKQFLFLLLKLQVPPAKKWLNLVFEGAEQSKEDLSALRDWETWDPRFKEARSTVNNIKKEEYWQKCRDLQDKSLFFRSQRLYSEEKETLEKLHRLCPTDEKIKNQLKETQELWSKEVISKAISNQENWLASRPSKTKRDQELEKQASHLFEFIREKESLDEGQLYNLALFFKFVEFPNHALRILEGIQHFAADWLRVDVYLDSQQYVIALEEASKNERKYSENPETSFASIYAKAIALRHLGQVPAAIELMQKITKVNSNYRSASQYIKDWKSL